MDHCVWYLLDWRVVFRYDTTTKTILVPSLPIVPKLLTGLGTTVQSQYTNGASKGPIYGLPSSEEEDRPRSLLTVIFHFVSAPVHSSLDLSGGSKYPTPEKTFQINVASNSGL